MQSVNDEKLVWHYTSGSGLKGILERNVLWASSAAYMNDSKEMQAGSEALSKYYAEQSASLDTDIRERIERSGALGQQGAKSAFLLSAAKDGDSLTLWRNYGKSETAFAVALDRSAPLTPLEQVPDEEHPNAPEGWYNSQPVEMEDGKLAWVSGNTDLLMTFSSGWKDVVYASDYHHDQIVDVYNSLVRNAKRDALILHSPFTGGELSHVKNVGFSDEDEVRLITEVNPEWKFVLTRPSRFGLTPYIELTSAASTQDESAKEATQLPIRAITVGPTSFSDEALHVVQLMLERNGFSDIELVVSETPYR
jgi:hypothetical protein